MYAIIATMRLTHRLHGQRASISGDFGKGRHCRRCGLELLLDLNIVGVVGVEMEW